mgnify:CR=1 FL=1
MKRLIIAPHADDEVLGVGGSVCKFIQNQDHVHLIVCGTRKNDSTEQINSATKHYTSCKVFPYQDESYFSVFDALLKSVEREYDRIRPDVVYIPSSRDFNQDHKCVHQVCEIVLRRYQQHPPQKILMYEIPSSTTQSFQNNFKCNYYEQLQLSHVNNKINTMSEYTNEMRDFPNPRSALGLMTYANMRGMECGCEYAEGFEIIYELSS